MRTIERTSRFKRDFKRERKTDSSVVQLLADVVQALATDQQLPTKTRPHKLTGDWQPSWDCHVKPDLLLIYQQPDDADVLRLIRLGSHSELFG